MIGVALTDMISDEHLRKGMLKLGQFVAPLVACFRTKDLRVEAHLQDHLPESGAAPSAGFFSDAGDRA
jgi:hypothetical protein